MSKNKSEADSIKSLFKGIWTLEDMGKPESEVS